MDAPPPSYLEAIAQFNETHIRGISAPSNSPEPSVSTPLRQILYHVLDKPKLVYRQQREEQKQRRNEYYEVWREYMINRAVDSIHRLLRRWELRSLRLDSGKTNSMGFDVFYLKY